MSIVPHWFLPTAGDGRTIVARRHADRGEAGQAQRPADVDYLAQVAHAAERLGFRGVLTPTGSFCEDAWLTTAALLRETRTLQLPGRLPARGHLADARRADGQHLPAPLRRAG